MSKEYYKLPKIDKETMKEVNRTPHLGDIMPNVFNAGIDVYNNSTKKFPNIRDK